MPLPSREVGAPAESAGDTSVEGTLQVSKVACALEGPRPPARRGRRPESRRGTSFLLQRGHRAGSSGQNSRCVEGGAPASPPAPPPPPGSSQSPALRPEAWGCRLFSFSCRRFVPFFAGREGVRGREDTWCDALPFSCRLCRQMTGEAEVSQSPPKGGSTGCHRVLG